MQSKRHEPGRGLDVREDLRPLGELASSVTLTVPARPEALGVVRLVLMSCGAAAGMEVDEIFSRSQEVADVFASILVSRPEATSIVIHAQTGTREIDVVPVREPEVRPRA